MYDNTERRTTIYTTITIITRKKFIEEEMVNGQWVTTDEYQVSALHTGIHIVWILFFICLS